MRVKMIPAMAFLAALCANAVAAQPASSPFGKLPGGKETRLYTLKNKNGMTVQISDFGATLVSVQVPDRNGKIEEVTHGFDSAKGYFDKTNPYFGATVGRFGNRIANGSFELDGKKYRLAKNNEPNGIPCHLHGGVFGFNRRLWDVVKADKSSITLRYVSRDGEEGYPGTLVTSVTYKLNNKNQLTWEVKATTDKPTVVNIVHHPYWNLSGDPTKSINDHILEIPASRFLPTDAGLIPTGELASVKETPMDFRKPKAIGKQLDQKFQPLIYAGGYDHCWVLDGKHHPSRMRLAARLKDPKSGRVMEIRSNQPAIQFYGGNFLDGTLNGRNSTAYKHRTALCLETEGFPDAPNQPNFPSVVLKPGKTYQHKMVYTFASE